MADASNCAAKANINYYDCVSVMLLGVVSGSRTLRVVRRGNSSRGLLHRPLPVILYFFCARSVQQLSVDIKSASLTIVTIQLQQPRLLASDSLLV